MITRLLLVTTLSLFHVWAAESAGKRIKYYRNPMDPSVHSDVPAKDSMGMNYIPVYENGAPETKSETRGRAAIQLSPEQLKLSGTGSAQVRREDLIRELRVPGRALGGSQISFQVFEQDLALIRTGVPFEAETPSLPGERLQGKVTSIESILDPMTRTARVNGTIASGSLRAESSVAGRIQIRRAQVLTVSESSVLHTGERNLVFVTDGQGAFTPREVVLGARGGGRIEVQKGLQEGESVSTGAAFLIDSESKIESTYDSPDH